MHAHFPPFSVTNLENNLEKYTIICDFIYLFISCFMSKRIFELPLKKIPETQEYKTNNRIHWDEREMKESKWLVNISLKDVDCK